MVSLSSVCALTCRHCVLDNDQISPGGTIALVEHCTKHAADSKSCAIILPHDDDGCKGRSEAPTDAAHIQTLFIRTQHHTNRQS